jgi:hypothetical protein
VKGVPRTIPCEVCRLTHATRRYTFANDLKAKKFTNVYLHPSCLETYRRRRLAEREEGV